MTNLRKIFTTLLIFSIVLSFAYVFLFGNSYMQIPISFLKSAGMAKFVDDNNFNTSSIRWFLSKRNNIFSDINSPDGTASPTLFLNPEPPSVIRKHGDNAVDPSKPSHAGKMAGSFRGPGDSNLPFEDEKSANLTKFPVDLFNEKSVRDDPRDANNPPLKKILYWNDAYGSKHFGFGFGQEPFIRAGCRVNTCEATGDRKRFSPEEIDAVLWHFRARDISLPAKRSPHTRFIFWMMESASYLYGDIRKYKGVFNWTFTYRLDSDLPNPYGFVYRRRNALPEQDYTNITGNKTKLAAWFVSNCNTVSGRKTLVSTLRQWIQIDIYGKCGEMKCDRKYQWDTCYKMLERDYKFYFSFENSLCRDYVTEKFFNILKFNVVPVVYGLGNYHLQAPPHSYINALDFLTPKALADYLLYLDSNSTAYNEYFQWKRYHRLSAAWERVARPYCLLCERLHTDTKIKVYDLHKWFVQESECKTTFNPDIYKYVTGTAPQPSASGTGTTLP